MSNSILCTSVCISRGILVYLDRIGEFLPQLGLRLLLAYEFWESGVQKYHGENWFADIQDRFPFPFDIVPVDLSWFWRPGANCLAPWRW